MFVYEQPKTGDIFTIVDPDLRLDQLEAVQKDVAHLLEHGLSVPVAPVETPAVAEAPVATEAPVAAEPESAPAPTETESAPTPS